VALLAAAVAFALAAARAISWTRAHLVIIGGLVLALVTVALSLWHRQQMERYRRHWVAEEGWARVPGLASRDMWACPSCRSLVAGIDQAEQHMDPAVSACAAFRGHLEEAEVSVTPGPGAGWPAVVMPEAETDDEVRESGPAGHAHTGP
jgi:hypothetical protein